MKRSYLFILICTLILTLQSTILSTDSKKERGASGVNELAKIVFNSVKLNDFSMIVNYIPNDTELELLKDQSQEKNKYLFENMKADDLQANTKINFDKLVKDGIVRNINWSEVEIQDSKINVCKTGDSRMCEAIMNIEDLKGTNMTISFDMIKVNGRWFVFQGIRERNPVGKK